MTEDMPKTYHYQSCFLMEFSGDCCHEYAAVTSCVCLSLGTVQRWIRSLVVFRLLSPALPRCHHPPPCPPHLQRSVRVGSMAEGASWEEIASAGKLLSS